MTYKLTFKIFIFIIKNYTNLKDSNILHVLFRGDYSKSIKSHEQIRNTTNFINNKISEENIILINDIATHNLSELNNRIHKLILFSKKTTTEVFYRLFQRRILFIGDDNKQRLTDTYRRSDFTSYLAEVFLQSLKSDNSEPIDSELTKTILTLISQIDNEINQDADWSLTLERTEELQRKSFLSARPFAESFEDTLFADEDSDITVILSDVYTNSILNVESEDFHDTFEKLTNHFVYKENDIDTSDTKIWQKWNRFLIEGQPGMGKSTLVKYIATKYLNRELFTDRVVFFISGKSLRNSKGNPLNDIQDTIGFDDFHDHPEIVLILDAYDEISYISRNVSNNQEYTEQLNDAVDKCTLIVTCRPGYITSKYFLRAEMEGFNSRQRRSFLSAYFKKKHLPKDEAKALIKEYTSGIEQLSPELGAKELVSIPMLLYIIASKKLHISEIQSRYNLYELLFTYDGNGIIVERGSKETKTISKELWDASYEFAKIIAHDMYMRSSTIIDGISANKLMHSLPFSEYKIKQLENRFLIEVFMKESDNREYTFVHKSIGEYFAAKYLSSQFISLINRYLNNTAADIDTIRDTICILFNEDEYNPVVLEFMSGDINNTDIHYTQEQINRIIELYHNLLYGNLPVTVDKRSSFISRYHNILVWITNVFSLLLSSYSGDQFAVADESLIHFLIKLNDRSQLYDLSLYGFDFSGMSFNNIDFGKISFFNCSFHKCYLHNAHIFSKPSIISTC